jgi:ankyrin repeat protein
MVSKEILNAIQEGKNEIFFQLFSSLNYSTNEVLKDFLFQMACEYNNLEIAKFIYSQGININGIHNDSYRTSLSWALNKGHFTIVDWLLTLPLLNPNVHCDGDESSLTFCIRHNYPIEIIRRLIKLGAALDDSLSDWLPLGLACYVNNVEAVYELLLAGCDPYEEDNDEQNAIFYANENMKKLLESWNKDLYFTLYALKQNGFELNSDIICSMVQFF